MAESTFHFPASTFEAAGMSIIRRNSRSNVTRERRFRAFFGTSPTVCSQIWGLLTHPPRAQAVHLLFGMLFLKVYSTEHIHASLCEVDERTFRHWSWIYIEKIASMKIVSFVFIFESF